MSTADGEVIRATLARLRLQSGFGADCDDGVLLADLACTALVGLAQVPPKAGRFRVSLHHCPSCEDNHVGDLLEESPGATERELTRGAGLVAAALDTLRALARAVASGGRGAGGVGRPGSSRRAERGPPRPRAPHVHGASSLGVHLGGPFGFGINGPGGWHIELEPELSLDTDPDFGPVVPDLAGCANPPPPIVPEDAQFTVVPDWVCELLSPRIAATDRTLEMACYARCGVAHAWLVDPELRTREAYRLDRGLWVCLGTWRDDASVRVEPFDAVGLPLGALWKGRAPRMP